VNDDENNTFFKDQLNLFSHLKVNQGPTNTSTITIVFYSLLYSMEVRGLAVD
jgi:hypothetical protein